MLLDRSREDPSLGSLSVLPDCSDILDVTSSLPLRWDGIGSTCSGELVERSFTADSITSVSNTIGSLSSSALVMLYP